MKKKISFIFDTRPEAIKLCPVILAMSKHPDLRPCVCITGQHRQMLDQVLEIFGVVPEFDLSLMKPDQKLASLTSRAIKAIDSYLIEHKLVLEERWGINKRVFMRIFRKTASEEKY